MASTSTRRFGVCAALALIAAPAACGVTAFDAVSPPDAGGDAGARAVDPPGIDGGASSRDDARNTQPDAEADTSPAATIDASGRTPPTCATPTPSINIAVGAGGSGTNRPGECDYLLQSVDFEDSSGYPSAPETIAITSYGTAFGAYAINSCNPYCYAKNFTIGVDIVGGADPSQLRGEVIFHFPASGPALPIATTSGRNALAWILLDGPTPPPFKISGQMVFETANGVVPAVEVKELAYHDWLNWMHAEFKYFPVDTPSGFPSAPTNVTGIGFRIQASTSLAKGQEWHGVAYIDHLQIRAGTPDNPPGAYPFGL